MPDERVTKQVFKWDKILLNLNSWSHNMEQLSDCLGVTDRWNQYLSIGIKCSTKKLIDYYELAWRDKVQSKHKLELFSKVKNSYVPEAYLTCNLPKSKRSLLCQLRCRVLGLQLELGRYGNVPVEDRICKLCNLSVETELHFLFQCRELSDCHKKFLSKHNIKLTNNDTENFKLLSCNGLFTLPDPDSDPCTDPDTCTMQKFHIGSDPDSDSEGFPYVYVS